MTFVAFFISFFVSSFFNPSLAGSQPDASHSSISVSPSSVPADGTTVVTITVTLKDSAGTALNGDTVSLSIPNNVAISPSSAILDASGKATFSVTSPSPNTDYVNVVDNSTSTTLVKFGQITFTASPHSAPSCPDPKPVGAPKLISTVVSGSNQITLTWTKALDPVSHYLVAYGVVSSQYIYGNPNVGGKDTISYTVGGLQKNVKYYFVVRAVNGCTPGDFSNELSANVSLVNPIVVPTATTVATVSATLTPTPTEIVNPFDNSIRNNTEQDMNTPSPTQTPEPQITSEQYQPANQESASDINYVVLIPAILVVISGTFGIIWYLVKKKKKDTETSDLEF